MEYIKVAMINESLGEIPLVALPQGFHFRLFRIGDSKIWAQIEAAVGEFKSYNDALAHFDEEFGSFEETMCKRCLFLEDSKSQSVGTATAWYNEFFRGGDYGRLHWVAVHPDYQGQGLGKALIAEALRKLKALHGKAYLTTQTISYKAINIYLEFGFTPLLRSDENRHGWTILAEKLHHPLLSEFM